jgi:bifunctional oligoribonuclease and PAP phosphatase NrnA
MITQADKINELINQATNVLIIQADNPDGDSLGAALALEQIVGDMGKTPHLYCGIDIPFYLKFLEGWDRISKDIPSNFDVSIIVDTSSKALLGQLEASRAQTWVASKPVIILDHHIDVPCDIPYATIVVNEPDFISTGELLFEISKELNWPLNVKACEFIAQSILSDSLGLTTDGVTAETYRRMADLIDRGVNRSRLEEARRALSKMHPSVFDYKAKLIERTEFYGDNSEIATVCIPEEELYTVGTLYNPAPLILNDIMMVEGVKVGIALKLYKDRVTGAVRCADEKGIAHLLAESFGGGGHPYAAGFKIEKPKSSLAEIKSQIIQKAQELLAQEQA